MFIRRTKMKQINIRLCPLAALWSSFSSINSDTIRSDAMRSDSAIRFTTLNHETMTREQKGQMPVLCLFTFSRLGMARHARSDKRCVTHTQSADWFLFTLANQHVQWPKTTTGLFKMESWKFRPFRHKLYVHCLN